MTEHQFWYDLEPAKFVALWNAHHTERTPERPTAEDTIAAVKARAART